MRLSNALAVAAALPAVQAMPHIPNSGVQIRDSATLDALKAEHEHTLQALRNKTLAARSSAELGEANHLEKRFAILGLAGMALIEAAGTVGGIVAGLENKLLSLFTDEKQEQIWHNHGFCRTYFETQGGGNCETRTYDRDSKDRTAEHKDGP